MVGVPQGTFGGNLTDPGELEHELTDPLHAFSCISQPLQNHVAVILAEIQSSGCCCRPVSLLNSISLELHKSLSQSAMVIDTATATGRDRDMDYLDSVASLVVP